MKQYKSTQRPQSPAPRQDKPLSPYHRPFPVPKAPVPSIEQTPDHARATPKLPPLEPLALLTHEVPPPQIEPSFERIQPKRIDGATFNQMGDAIYGGRTNEQNLLAAMPPPLPHQITQRPGETLHTGRDLLNRPLPPHLHIAPVQPKLTIGAVGDRYEQEADRVAKAVVQRLDEPQAENTRPTQSLAQQPGEGAIAADEELETAIQQTRGSGEYNKAETRSGRKRVAHEIVHTVQQVDNSESSLPTIQRKIHMDLSGSLSKKAKFKGLIGRPSTFSRIQTLFAQYQSLNDPLQEKAKLEELKELVTSWLRKHPTRKSRNAQDRATVLLQLAAKIDQELNILNNRISGNPNSAYSPLPARFENSFREPSDTDADAVYDPLPASIREQFGNLSDTEADAVYDPLPANIREQFGNLSDTDVDAVYDPLPASIREQFGNLSDTDVDAVYDPLPASIREQFGNLSDTEADAVYDPLPASIREQFGNLSDTEADAIYDPLPASIREQFGNLSDTEADAIYDPLPASIREQFGNLSDTDAEIESEISSAVRGDSPVNVLDNTDTEYSTYRANYLDLRGVDQEYYDERINPSDRLINTVWYAFDEWQKVSQQYTAAFMAGEPYSELTPLERRRDFLFEFLKLQEIIEVDEEGNISVPSVENRLVEYDDAEAQQSTLVNISGGKLLRNDGMNTPVDTSESVTFNKGKGWEIYVMSPTGEIHMASQKIGKYQHSSLLAGTPTAAAGQIRVVNGKIEWLDNKSGHYKPGPKQVVQILHQLEKAGVSMDFRLIVVLPSHERGNDDLDVGYDGSAEEYLQRAANELNFDFDSHFADRVFQYFLRVKGRLECQRAFAERGWSLSFSNGTISLEKGDGSLCTSEEVRDVLESYFGEPGPVEVTTR